MSYKKYKFEILGRDANSPFFRNYIWTKCFFTYPSLLGISRFVAGISSENDKIDYIVDFSSWRKCYDELSQKLKNDFNFLGNLIDKTNKVGEEFNTWTEKNIFDVDVKKLTTKEIIKKLKYFEQKQGELYALGVALPILDIHTFKFVEGNLTTFLKEKVSEKEFQEYYGTFTQPINNSFAQNQEEDLLKLIQEFYNKTWVEDVKNKRLEELKEVHPNFYKKLQDHTQKYCWVYYVYAGPAFGEQHFFEFIQDYVKKGVDPTKKLAEFKENKKAFQKKKKEYMNKLHPDEFQKTILNLAGKVVWAKPRRKDYQSKSYYHVEKLHREIARRLIISLDQARNIPIEMLEDALNSGEIDENLLNTIKKNHVILPNDDGSVTLLQGDEAKKFVEENIKRKEEKIDLNVSQLQGTCACSGKVSGTVKVINVPSDMPKMNEGDILVSVATTPSIVPAMKKAAAILTDEGGLTCHAAIVSREMGIPSIVGLKFVTKILKDGDRVEVDAGKGVVKKPL